MFDWLNDWIFILALGRQKKALDQHIHRK
jgi:hypothetical protein